MSEYEIKSPVPQATQDARDLLMRLYREIGISAVSAALQMREPAPKREPATLADLPSVLRKENLAA